MSDITSKTWGLHLFKSSLYPGLHCGSYFVERPYSSFIIFPPQENSMQLPHDFALIESKGGAAFQFHLYGDRPNFLQRKLYERFGCPLICPWTDEHFNHLMHEDYSFRYGKMKEDFYDLNVDFIELIITVQKGQIIRSPSLYVVKKDQAFVFLGAPWLHDRGTVRHAPTGQAVLKIALEEGQFHGFPKKINLIFQFFRGLNWSSGEGVVF